MDLQNVLIEKDYHKHSGNFKGLKKNILHIILDFLCDKYLYTEIPFINKYIYSLHKEYLKSRTNIIVPLKMYSCEFYINTGCLDLLYSANNLIYLEVYIYNYDDYYFEDKDIGILFKQVDLSFKKLKLYFKNLPDFPYLDVDHTYEIKFDICLMEEVEELYIVNENEGAAGYEFIIISNPNLKKIKSDTLFDHRHTNGKIRKYINHTCAKMSKSIQSEITSNKGALILQNIANRRYLRSLALHNNFLWLNDELAEMLKKNRNLTKLKFESISNMKVDLKLVNNFLKIAMNSNLEMLYFTTPVKSLYKSAFMKAKENQDYINNIDLLITRCQTLKHIRLHGIERFSDRNIEDLASIIISHTKLENLKTFNKINLNMLLFRRFRWFSICRCLIDSPKHSYLCFLLLSEFNTLTLETENNFPKELITELITESVLESMIKEKSFTIKKINLQGYIMFILAKKINNFRTISINSTSDIVNRLSSELIIASNCIKVLEFTVFGNKNYKIIHSILKKNPFCFSNLEKLDIDLKNEILILKTFSELLMSNSLISVKLKNFTVYADKPLENFNKLLLLNKLKISNAAFSQIPYDYLIDIIKFAENISILVIEKCCVRHKKKIVLDEMMRINNRNAEMIIDILSNKTNLEYVDIKTNRDVLLEGSIGSKNADLIDKIFANNKNLKKFVLRFPFVAELS